MKTSPRGILLIAISHPNYGRMASNLAMTIKAAEPDMQIGIIADHVGLSHLNEKEKALFSYIIPAPETVPGLKGVYNIRMRLPALTPFEETLALDVDMLWLQKHKPSELFQLLADRDFTSVNEGYHDLATGENHTTDLYPYWANIEDVKAAYEVKGKLWQYRGEFLLFRNTKEVKAMFGMARKIQAKPAVEVKGLTGGVNEEFAWSVASNLVGIEPHASSEWQPTFWAARHGGVVPEPSKIPDQYYAITFGGNHASARAQRAYHILAAAAAYKLGLRFRFPLQSKRHYLTERRRS